MAYLTVKDGTRLYYEIRPAKNPTPQTAKETLLVIHGLGSSHFELEKFIDDLNEKYPVVLYDQRNHGNSDHSTIHLNVQSIGQDLNEVITKLGLSDITAIGHSMGAAAIFSYVGQYGTDLLKRVVVADMSPYLRNKGWKGGIGLGEWTDENFMEDLDRSFNDPGEGTWFIMSHLMNPGSGDLPEEEEKKMIELFRENTDPLAFPAFWYSLYRTDQRPSIEKIDIPVLYLMPETALYSTVNTDYIRDHIKSSFTLAEVPGTTHLLLMEKPQETARIVENFISSTD